MEERREEAWAQKVEEGPRGPSSGRQEKKDKGEEACKLGT